MHTKNAILIFKCLKTFFNRVINYNPGVKCGAKTSQLFDLLPFVTLLSIEEDLLDYRKYKTKTTKRLYV